MSTVVPLAMIVVAVGFVDPPKIATSKASPAKSERERAFELLDRNKSGSLDVNEFLAGTLGKAADNKTAQFSKWDLNSDQQLTIQEFRQQGSRSSGQFNPQWEFDRRDRNRDQLLTVEEFLLHREGELDPYEKRFKAIDQNNDHQITFEEFTSKHEVWRQQERSSTYRQWFGGALVLADVLFVAMLGVGVMAWFRRPRAELAAGPATVERVRKKRRNGRPQAKPQAPKSIDEFEVS